MPYRISCFLALLVCACTLCSSAQTLVTTIPVSGDPYGIAVNPSNNRIYVGLNSALDVVDGSTNEVIATVPTPQGASYVAVNVNTGRVYGGGCNYSQNPVTCGVTVLDGATNAVIATIPLKGSNGIGVQAITVNPVTNRVYVADDMIFQVAVIDGSTNAVLTYIKTGRTELLGLAVDISTGQILGAASGEAMLAINGTNDAVTRVRVVGPNQATINQDVAANPLTNLAYVTNNAGATLGVVDLVSLKQIAYINMGTAPYGVSVDPLSNKIFVAVNGEGTVAEVDGNTNEIVGTVFAGANNLCVNPVTRLVYGTETFASAIAVISE